MSSTPPCQPRPSSAEPADLGFVRKPMVRWLDPHQLVDTAGVDIQFGSYIDEAQLRYFAGVALSHAESGDRIILCTAKEVDSGRKGTEIHSDRDVEFLEREIITPCGARLVLYLKSGKHYYARYEQEDACVSTSLPAAAAPSYIPPTTFPSVWTFLAQRDPSPTAKPAPTRHRRNRNG